ncbi:hypothetical protein AVT69_gp228 [Pseudomonas phage PhiPA3]|uniref:Uncharacterized protein 230 n=1 Tax=Pseudomonas phage PhiPA3 TaxID=998086 RepID=F8SJ73_BPPA3|nr:hypothetical protein AVT69_gp228 [Pseudomonas phage PhiPA3]AEH03653.1 hypothetical protein [Pseudomonas phage PhiPA3]
MNQRHFGGHMPLTCTKVPEIDQFVTEGKHIGYFGKEDNITDLPSVIGDWNIRAIYDRVNPTTGYIVAVPSNTRTRVIYNTGRANWLQSLGYTSKQADLYIRASTIVNGRWDHRVAEFVLKHFHMDDYVIEEVIQSDRPKKVCQENNINTKLSARKILTACQILYNMRFTLVGA